MSEDELKQELKQLVTDLGWDYDRMSSSGQETYAKICSIIDKLTE